MDSVAINQEVQDTLRVAIDKYGLNSLSNPAVLSGICEDRLGELTREKHLIVTAASSGIADIIRQHAQAVGFDQAIMLAADTLSRKFSLERSSCVWVVSHFAKAIGYPVTQLPILERADPELGILTEPEQNSAQEEATTSNMKKEQSDSGNLTIIDSTYPTKEALYDQPNNMEGQQGLLSRSQYQPVEGSGNYNIPISPGPSAYPGPSPDIKRSRRKLVLVVFAVIVVAIYAISARSAKIFPFNATAASTTNPSNSSLPVSTAPSKTTAQLEQYVPSYLQGEATCSNVTYAVKALAEIECKAISGANLPISGIDYALFSSKSNLYLAYDNLVNIVGATLNGPSCGNFQTFSSGCEEPYIDTATNTTLGRVSEGSYKNSPQIIATVDKQLVLVDIFAAPGQGNWLVTWASKIANWDANTP